MLAFVSGFSPGGLTPVLAASLWEGPMFQYSLRVLGALVPLFVGIFLMLPRGGADRSPIRYLGAALVVLSLVGGAAGAALLLVTPDATFRRVVPWLLLMATALFALGPQLRAKLAGGTSSTAKATLGILAVAVYGGYFNGGLGILLLALFGLLGQTNINAMNGLKNWVSALLTAIAVAIYAAGGVVLWPQALMMMLAATAGGYGGARVARRIPAQWLRGGIVVTGLVMAGLFFARQ